MVSYKWKAENLYFLLRLYKNEELYMLRALTTAATGMIAQQNYLDVIANNVANVNTTGYKQSRIEFQDLLLETELVQFWVP